MMKLKLALAATLLAAGANAQNFTTANTDGNPDTRVKVSVGTLNSATTPRAVPVGAFENLFISCVGTAATSQTVLFQTAAGRTVDSASVACGTSAAVVISRTAGLTAASGGLVVISPTAGLTAANVVTNTIVRVPAVTR